MKKYDLVTKEYNNNGNYLDDNYVIINGKYLSNIYDIDRYTSSMSFHELWNSVFMENKLEGFNSLMIRVVDGANIYYEDIIINNKTINSCVNDVDSKGYINKDNNFFKKEFKDFLMFINSYDIKIIRDGLLGKDDDELFVIINDFKENRDNDIYEKLVNSFSNYVVFRKWILNKEIIRRNGIYDNHLKDYYDKNMDFVRKFNILGGDFSFDEEREEFLTRDELKHAGIIEDNKVRGKRL